MKNNRSTTRWRKALRFLFFALCALLLLAMAAMYTLTLPVVQQRFTWEAETFLQKKLGTRVAVGAIRLRFPYFVSLENFLLEDQQGDTLARVGSLVVDIGMWKLLSRTIELQQITLRELSKSLGSSPAALLAGGEAVEKSFTLKNATRKDGLAWVLALPKDKESGFERVLLGFKADKLRKMELYDSFSHVTLITFDEVERNPILQEATFLFTPPKGVDVVGE